MLPPGCGHESHSLGQSCYEVPSLWPASDDQAGGHCIGKIAAVIKNGLKHMFSSEFSHTDKTKDCKNQGTSLGVAC